MIPALNAFGIPLAKVGDHIDGLTYLTKNSTVDFQDFTGTMSSLGPKLNDMGLSMEDSEAIMLGLSKAGYEGTAATRLFRSAVTDSKGNVDDLYKSLGLTKDVVDGYKTKIDGAKGSTKDYAAAAESGLGATDKIKSAFDKFTLSAGSLLSPLDGVGAAFATAGPLILGLTQLPTLIGGVTGAFTFLAANPIVLAIAGIVIVAIILETKFGLLSKAAQLLGQGWSWLSDNVISPFIRWLGDATKGIDWVGVAFHVLLGPIALVYDAIRFLGDNWGTIWGSMMGIAKTGINWLIDGINLMVWALNLLDFKVPDWVPLIGGQHIGFSLAQIPRLAEGGIVTSPTIAMIGESGPEAVVPLSPGGVGGAVGDIYFTGPINVRKEDDIKRVAQELHTLITRTNRGRGTS